ncbi:hypothetical protein [Paenibacillus terrae]|uniref:hypothetical protein n=1 Tax=Paenibacillus terrae TaxID=159743 RepID=UPI0016568C0C|nr:hypothetical protein [Paenibacillus terrae]
MCVATLEKPEVSAGGSGNKPPYVAEVASGVPDFNNEGSRAYEKCLANRGQE